MRKHFSASVPALLLALVLLLSLGQAATAQQQELSPPLAALVRNKWELIELETVAATDEWVGLYRAHDVQLSQRISPGLQCQDSYLDITHVQARTRNFTFSAEYEEGESVDAVVRQRIGKPLVWDQKGWNSVSGLLGAGERQHND